MNYWNRSTPYHTHYTLTLNTVKLHNRKALLWTRLGIQRHFKKHTHSKYILVPTRGSKTVLRNEIFRIYALLCLQKYYLSTKLIVFIEILSDFLIIIRFSWKNSISIERYKKNTFVKTNDVFFFIFLTSWLPKLPLAEI